MTPTQTTALIRRLIALCLLVSSYAQAAPSSTYEEDSGPLAQAQKELREQNYAGAIDELKAVIQLEQNNADAYNLLGYSNRKLKRFDVAERYYEKALTLEPDHEGAMEYLGELYVETGRIDEAKAMLARLDDACFFFCSEYRQLKATIEDYETSIDAADTSAQKVYSMGYYSLD